IYPPLENKTVIVTVTDLCSISVSDTVSITVDPKAILTNNPPEKAICSGEQTGITLVSNISDPGFTWDPIHVNGNIEGSYGGSGNSINQILVLSDQAPGSVLYQIIVSGNGCDTTKGEFLVVVNPVPVLDLGENFFMDPGGAAELHAGGGFTVYSWSTGSSDSVITIDQGGLYSVSVQNKFGCLAFDTIMVNELGLYIPNAFTPNGDGLNDRFQVLGFDQTGNVSMRIFNRWGVRVFETTNPEEGWDGTYGGQLCPPETYAWILRWGLNLQRTTKGTITLIR
ncbi:MAG: gliding motility-associated C-terminal domain-containing protein, partial [bacterium]